MDLLDRQLPCPFQGFGDGRLESPPGELQDASSIGVDQVGHLPLEAAMG